MPRKNQPLVAALELLSVAAGARRQAHEQAATGRQASGQAGRPASRHRASRRTHRHRASGPRPGGQDARHVARSFHSAGPSAGRYVNHLAYALYLPAAPATTAGMPVVVMLHGCKQSAESFAAGTRICRLAERSGFAVLFPEQAKTAHAHRCWHWHGDATESEAAAVTSLVDAIVRQHGFDRDRISGGMSPEPETAAALAIRYPDRFAAVGLHSGPAIAPPSSTLAAMNLMRRGLRDDPIRAVDACADVASYPGMPALVMHGALDTVVTDRNATQLGIAFARLNRLVDEHGAMRVGEQRTYARDDADYVDYLKAGRLVVRVCIVRRLPHAWSGGDRASRFIPPRGRTPPRCSGNSFVANAASGCDDVRQPRRPTARGAVTRSRPVRQLRRVLSIAGAPDRDRTQNVVPRRKPLVTSMVPRWRLTMPCDTDKPSPCPARPASS